MSSSTTNNNSNRLSVVPVFKGDNYHLWAEKIEDYLKSQKLWGYVKLGGTSRPSPTIANVPTADEQKAVDDWDEVDDQAKGIIALCLAHSLRTHLKPTARVTWNALETTYGTRFRR